MVVLERRSGVGLERFGTGHLENLVAAGLIAPSLDIDQVQKSALGIGEEDRAHPIGQSEEAFDGRERLYAGAPCWRNTGTARILGRAKQQNAGRNRPILVARQSRHTQQLDDGGHAIGQGRAPR